VKAFDRIPAIGTSSSSPGLAGNIQAMSLGGAAAQVLGVVLIGTVTPRGWRGSAAERARCG
jgi:hypothetical protein